MLQELRELSPKIRFAAFLQGSRNAPLMAVRTCAGLCWDGISSCWSNALALGSRPILTIYRHLDRFSHESPVTWAKRFAQGFASTPRVPIRDRRAAQFAVGFELHH